MSSPEDRRVHARLSLDDRYTLRFQVVDQVFRGVPMTNLSIGGLGLRMEQRTTIRIHPGIILKGMVLEHPTLPQMKVGGQMANEFPIHLQGRDGRTRQRQRVGLEMRRDGGRQ